MICFCKHRNLYSCVDVAEQVSHIPEPCVVLLVDFHCYLCFLPYKRVVALLCEVEQPHHAKFMILFLSLYSLLLLARLAKRFANETFVVDFRHGGVIFGTCLRALLFLCKVNQSGLTDAI